MQIWIQMLITLFASVMASGGFWAFLQGRHDQKDSRTKVILGLGYDRIIALGMKYIERGWITQDEYENLERYIYRPYNELRPDDGSVRKIMQEVDRLPIKNARKG